MKFYIYLISSYFLGKSWGKSVTTCVWHLHWWEACRMHSNWCRISPNAQIYIWFSTHWGYKLRTFIWPFNFTIYFNVNLENVSYLINNGIWVNCHFIQPLSIYIKKDCLYVYVFTCVPLSWANRRTNLHQILCRPLHQLREGSKHKYDPANPAPWPKGTPNSKT